MNEESKEKDGKQNKDRTRKTGETNRQSHRDRDDCTSGRTELMMGSCYSCRPLLHADEKGTHVDMRCLESELFCL